MEDKLKTLKDMKDKLASHIVEQREFLPEAEFVSVDDLKQEAIKWVKDIVNKDTLNMGNDPYCCPYSIKRFIKHFFNLTEEDLK